jgi:hypothetical protein
VEKKSPGDEDVRRREGEKKYPGEWRAVRYLRKKIFFLFSHIFFTSEHTDNLVLTLNLREI